MIANSNEMKTKLEKMAGDVFDRNQVRWGDLFFHMPAVGAYQSMFAWDSGWHAIALSLFSPDLAFKELESVFSFQLENGLVPHEARIEGMGKSETLFRKLLIKSVFIQFDSQGRSRLIDPPSYLLAAEIVYNRTKDSRILRLLPSMLKCLEYLMRERTPLGDDLICIIHPWESGTDAAPYFDGACRVDVRQPSWFIRYAVAYLKQLKEIERLGWDCIRILKKGAFAFQDVGMNGLAAAGAMSVSRLFAISGDIANAEKCRSIAERIINACNEHLWDDQRAFYFPRWLRPEPEKIFRTCLNGLMPLLSGIAPDERAREILDRYVASSSHFACSHGVQFNSESEADLKWFRDSMLWRGPCIWISMNWAAAEAASIYGRKDVAGEITDKTAKLIAENGFHEYYDPCTGRGKGAFMFTWPALVLDMLERHGG
jgi:glycogen debranching enzyme